MDRPINRAFDEVAVSASEGEHASVGSMLAGHVSPSALHVSPSASHVSPSAWRGGRPGAVLSFGLVVRVDNGDAATQQPPALWVRRFSELASGVASRQEPATSGRPWLSTLPPQARAALADALPLGCADWVRGLALADATPPLLAWLHGATLPDRALPGPAWYTLIDSASTQTTPLPLRPLLSEVVSIGDVAALRWLGTHWVFDDVRPTAAHHPVDTGLWATLVSGNNPYTCTESIYVGGGQFRPGRTFTNCYAASGDATLLTSPGAGAVVRLWLAVGSDGTRDYLMHL